MTTPIPALLSIDDLQLFQSSDPTFFLDAAGETLRTFCQWHIFPSITVTDTVEVKPDGTIMLPSMFVTDVASVTIGGLELDPSTYSWFEPGYIKRLSHQYYEWPLWPLESDQPFHAFPSSLAQHAVVTYTHGYSVIPSTVNAVAMELTSRALELPAGNATNLSAGPNTIGLNALGLILTGEDRRRLGPFALVRF